MKDTNFIARTNGSGLWSNAHRPVRVVGYELAYQDDLFGELRVYFDEDTWSVEDLGLIYTDKLFVAEVREFLESRGYTVSDDNVDYSEQGMQGEDFVSFDVSGDIVAELAHGVGESV